LVELRVDSIREGIELTGLSVEPPVDSREVRSCELLHSIKTIINGLAEDFEFRIHPRDVGLHAGNIALDPGAVSPYLGHIGLEHTNVTLKAFDLLAQKSKVNFLGHRRSPLA
jgi:hypothetical protein